MSDIKQEIHHSITVSLAYKTERVKQFVGDAKKSVEKRWVKVLGKNEKRCNLAESLYLVKDGHALLTYEFLYPGGGHNSRARRLGRLHLLGLEESF